MCEGPSHRDLGLRLGCRTQGVFFLWLSTGHLRGPLGHAYVLLALGSPPTLLMMPSHTPESAQEKSFMEEQQPVVRLWALMYSGAHRVYFHA